MESTTSRHRAFLRFPQRALITVLAAFVCSAIFGRLQRHPAHETGMAAVSMSFRFKLGVRSVWAMRSARLIASSILVFIMAVVECLARRVEIV